MHTAVAEADDIQLAIKRKREAKVEGRETLLNSCSARVRSDG